MAIEFVGISTAYIASGASSITIARPAGTVEGDVMLLVAFARLGTFAAASTDPPGQNYGNFEVLADDGTRWTTRYNAQYLLYRPVLASEPTSYTFAFASTLGAVEDNYIVAALVAYRGAETADPVGAFDSIGDPIPWGDSGLSLDPGRQFEASPYASSGGSRDSPWGASYWYTRVDGMRAVFVVIVDWSTPDAPTWPDPPADVEVVFPDGWVERTPAGSWLKIADGPAATDPDFDGAEDVGAGTWRGRATQSWDIGSYTLSSPTLATPDVVLGGHTFELAASSNYFPIYAGAEVVPPPVVVVATAAVRDQRVRTDPPVIIRVGGRAVTAAERPATASGGPVVLLGNEYEPGLDVGSIGPYVPLFVTVLDLITNGGSGVLVIGGGKYPDDPDPITYGWGLLGSTLGVAVSLVNGAGPVAAASFAGYALLVVASSGSDATIGSGDTYGGLDDGELSALVARKAEIVAFVAAGGGLVAGQPTVPPSDQTDPWPVCEYLASGIAVSGWGTFGGAYTIPSTEFATPTAVGIALGLQADEEFPRYCSAEDPYVRYPSTLSPVASDGVWIEGGSGGGATGVGAVHFGGAATRSAATARVASQRLRVH